MPPSILGRRARFAALAIVAVAFAACGSVPGIPGVALPADLRTSAWVVVELSEADLDVGRPPFLRFDGGQVLGATGCNDFSADYRLDGGRIELGAIGMTRIGCDGIIGRQEAAFVRALEGVELITFDGQRLALNGPGGSMVLDRVVDLG